MAMGKETEKPKRSLFGKIVSTIVTISGVLAIGVVVLSIYDSYSTSRSMSCEGIVETVMEISEGNRPQNGYSIVGVVEIETLSREKTRNECKGLAVLSNTSTLPITFRSYVEYDQWWIAYEPQV